MAQQFRHKTQSVADVASAQGITNPPFQANDSVDVESVNTLFQWKEGSTATHDGVNVIEVTAFPSGRLIAESVSNTYTGTATSDPIANGVTLTVDVTVTGVLQIARNLQPIVTNAKALLDSSIIIVNTLVSADDTVTVILQNLTGNDLPGQTVDVRVIALR